MGPWDVVQGGDVVAPSFGGEHGERGQDGGADDAVFSPAVDDQVGHELERALVVVFEALGVDRDLVAAEVAGGFAGEVDVLHAFAHRNVELAGGGQVRDDVREDLAVVAGGRLAFRVCVAEVVVDHGHLVGDRHVDLGVLSAGG